MRQCIENLQVGDVFYVEVLGEYWCSQGEVPDASISYTVQEVYRSKSGKLERLETNSWWFKTDRLNHYAGNLDRAIVKIKKAKRK